MTIPVLDVFVLSVLDRGAQSAYDLHRIAGISLGASTPSFARLLDLNLVTREQGSSGNKRIRYAFRLTAAGRKVARSIWKPLLTESRILDLDSTLRILDMALHYGADPDSVRKFLRRSATERLKLADQADVAAQESPGAHSKLTYCSLKVRCDARRLRGEADVLLTTAGSLKGRKAPVAAQQPLL